MTRPDVTYNFSAAYEDLAARTIAKIDRQLYSNAGDRERVDSDLTGLRRHSRSSVVTDLNDGPSYAIIRDFVCTYCHREWPCPDAKSYSAGLLRTATIYGVTP